MQQIGRNTLVKKACELLNAGMVDRVLGWRKADTGIVYDVEPAVFVNVKEIEEEFIWNDFCGANLSGHLIEEAQKTESKVLIFLKPCDKYSYNQLLTEYLIDSTKVIVQEIDCTGMIDICKLKNQTGGIRDVSFESDKAVIHSLYQGDIRIAVSDLLAERCINCKSRDAYAYERRFDEVKRIEDMSADERYEFWQRELSKCIRCNACRNICPACSCEKCIFDNPESGVENKAAADSFEEKMFHIIRAFHVAGRCTDCGECSRVCPQHIPLHLLNRKMIKDINNFYGEYQAGAVAGSRSPVVSYSLDDIEPAEREANND